MVVKYRKDKSKILFWQSKLQLFGISEQFNPKEIEKSGLGEKNRDFRFYTTESQTHNF